MLIPILTLIEIKISRKLLNGIKSDKKKTILIAYRKDIFIGNHHYHT